MAIEAALFLKADGVDIHGESTVTAGDREDSIEVLQYSDSVSSGIDRGTGSLTGRRTYTPIKIIKRIDKSTPLLFKALCNNEVIEAEFRFYRPSVTGDGRVEHFFTIAIYNGRIVNIERTNPHVLDTSMANYPTYEEVSIHFSRIVTTYEGEGVTVHEDTWGEEA